MGIGTDVDSWYLDKMTVGDGRFVWSQVYETLVRLDSDLNIIPGLADRIAVMYAGEIVEIGKAEAVISDPEHPYTLNLLHSLPEKGLRMVSGQPPSLVSPPPGCRYHPRCSFRFEACPQVRPRLLETGGEHFTRCFLSEKGWKKGTLAQFPFAEKPVLRYAEEDIWNC